jgi:hypothetical protein
VGRLLAPLPASSGFSVNIPLLDNAANGVGKIATTIRDSLRSVPSDFSSKFLAPQGVLGDYPAAQGLMNSFNDGGYALTGPGNLNSYDPISIMNVFIGSLTGSVLDDALGAQSALNFTAEAYRTVEAKNQAAINNAVAAIDRNPESAQNTFGMSWEPGYSGYWGDVDPATALALPIRQRAEAGSWGGLGGLDYDIDNFWNDDQTYRILYATVQAMQPGTVEGYAKKFHGYANAVLDGCYSLRKITEDLASEWTGETSEWAMQDLAATIGIGAVISAGMAAVANAAEWHAAKQRAWQHALVPPGESGWDTSNQVALKLMAEIQQQTVDTNDAIPKSLDSLGLKVPYIGAISSTFSPPSPDAGDPGD